MKRISFFRQQKVKQVTIQNLQFQNQETIEYVGSYQTFNALKTQNNLSNASTNNCLSSIPSKTSIQRCSVNSNFFNQVKEENFKTQVCKYWRIKNYCPFGDNCKFAHGQQELRYKHVIQQKYRTKFCKKFFDQGACPYGNRCQFLHQKNFIQRQKQFYRKRMSQIHKDKNLFFLNQKRLGILKLLQLEQDIQNSLSQNSSQNRIQSPIFINKKPSMTSILSLQCLSNVKDDKMRFSIRI